jgi:hypothetical protein
METKEQLINNIKEWIKLDTDITQLRRLIKEKNEKKKNLTDNLMSVMKNNEIDCFDINGGALIYKKTTVKKPICSKSLLSVLQNYYKEDVKMAEELTKHIMNNREEKIKETVHRKIAKIKEEISL